MIEYIVGRFGGYHNHDFTKEYLEDKETRYTNFHMANIVRLLNTVHYRLEKANGKQHPVRSYYSTPTF